VLRQTTFRNNNSAVSNEFKVVNKIQVVYTLLIESPSVSNQRPCWLFYDPSVIAPVIFQANEVVKHLETVEVSCAHLQG
jgi:hypothetical protein